MVNWFLAQEYKQKHIFIPSVFLKINFSFVFCPGDAQRLVPYGFAFQCGRFSPSHRLNLKLVLESGRNYKREKE